jgi:hypothetical protein
VAYTIKKKNQEVVKKALLIENELFPLVVAWLIENWQNEFSNL